MEVHVTSLDERAAGLLESGGIWDLVARYERSFFIARHPDGALLSIVRHDLPDGPYTVRLDDRAPRDMRLIDAPPHLDRLGARSWRSPRVQPSEAVDRTELARRFLVLGRILDQADSRQGGAAALIPTDACLALEDALAADDPGQAAAAAVPIAGLGPGLTPSGDDLLIGALATHAWAEAAGFGGNVEMRTAIAMAAAPRTSRLVGQLFVAAAAGDVTAPLAGLLSAVFRRGGSFPPDVSAVLAIGATSGSDLLVGVRICGRALARRSVPGDPTR